MSADNREDIVEAILMAAKDSPGLSCKSMANALGLTQIETMRWLDVMRIDHGAADGPALLRLERRADFNISSTRIYLTDAAEALWTQ